MPAVAGAQTVSCPPAELRQSLVRIERRPPLAPGTGVVIVRRDAFAIVLTARHVIATPSDFGVYFLVAPTRRFPVSFTDDAIFGLPERADSVDLAVFRVDGQIPAEVVPEDPFTRESIDVGSTMVSWGYPAARGGIVCSHQGRLQGTSSGLLIAEGFVETGVSGGPMFLIDPVDKSTKLAGLVVAGDGNALLGTTRAIDIRQAVTLVATSADRRNGNRPHVWPNIPLPDEIAVGAFHSFRRVPVGAFVMGSSQAADERWPGTGSSGQATLTSAVFYMGKYEVTVEQYQQCVTDRACASATRSANLAQPDLPVVGVTWNQATTYADWLTQRLRSRPETDRTLRRLLDAGWEFDLPSEEEWEKAARRRGIEAYPWGNGPNPRNANYNTGRLRPVSSSRCDACEFGLFDMAGNAREWTRSLKVPYPYVAATAEDPTAPGNRAIRGGSYERMSNASLAALTVRAANRQDAAPSAFDEYTGFRLALICKKERGCSWQEPDAGEPLLGSKR